MYIIAYLECLFLSTTVSTFLASKYKIKHNQDYIIILGCAIRKDGSLTPLLKNRVDAAVEFEKDQFEETGKHAIFVPSGGQGSDEIISEGEAMEKYLVSIGIPKERILKETKSINTFQNMQYSKAIIEKDTENINSVNIAFSTTNYHVFRSYILAKKNGFKAMGISAKTKPYFFSNAFLREFIGLLFDHKWKIIIYLILLILAGILMSFHHLYGGLI
jgi:vancomycin permeability regulator SanA